MKTLNYRLIIVAGLGCPLMAPFADGAVTLTSGDVWNTASGDGGSLKIPGFLSAAGGVDFGVEGAFAGVQMDYDNSANKLTVDLYENSGIVEWRDGGIASPAPLKLKMRLTGDNKLELFNGSGAASISLNGSSGIVTTSGSLSAGGLTISQDSFFNGVRVGRGNSSNGQSTAVGLDSLPSNSTGTNNTAFGWRSLYTNSSGSWNVAVGALSLEDNTSGRFNTGIGFAAATNNTTGESNTAIGYAALSAQVGPGTGSYNSALGHNTMAFNSSGHSNTAIGAEGLLNNTSGVSNSTIGRQAAFSNSTGSYNIALGSSALYYNTTGYNNVAIGYLAGAYQNSGSPLSTVSSGVYIGYNVKGGTNSEVNAIVLGSNAVGKGANTTVIGNTSTVRTYLHGGAVISENTAVASDVTNTENVFVLGNGPLGGAQHTAIAVSRDGVGGPGGITFKAPVNMAAVPFNSTGTVTFSGQVVLSGTVQVTESAGLTVPAKGGITMGEFAP